ncbi:hypothetical protein M3Y97_00375100 [Aphelenchoides bicaudatus]|nr:hypothetical protein M3Y97_00375100 [Aphelenchoides bicaudatus]
MELKVLLSALSVAIVCVYCAGPNPDAERVDFDAVFKGLHLDPCNAKCVQNLKPALINTLKLVNIYNSSEELCNAYDATLSCTKKSFCFKNQVLTVVTSGLEDLCKTDKHTFIKDNENCIKPKIDGVSQSCDAKCHFVKEFADYSHDPTVQKSLTVLQMLDKLEGVCQSLSCYLPCLRNGLNGCSQAGKVYASGILRPFYIAADFLGKMAPNVQQLISQKLPKSCAPLINVNVLNNITGATQ